MSQLQYGKEQQQRKLSRIGGDIVGYLTDRYSGQRPVYVKTPQLSCKPELGINFAFREVPSIISSLDYVCLGPRGPITRVPGAPVLGLRAASF